MPAAAKVVADTHAAPRTRKGESSRARLIEAARAVFEEDGFLDARITDIAERAGLGHGTFYHYFDSKEAVLREVAAALAERLVPPLDETILAALTHSNPREQIRKGNQAFLAQYRKEARLISEVDRAAHLDPQLLEQRYDHHKRHGKIVANAIRANQEAGLNDPRLNPEIAAQALGGIASRFADLWAVQKLIDCSYESAVDQLTILMCNALGVPDDGTPKNRRK